MIQSTDFPDAEIFVTPLSPQGARWVGNGYVLLVLELEGAVWPTSSRSRKQQGNVCNAARTTVYAGYWQAASAYLGVNMRSKLRLKKSWPQDEMSGQLLT